MYFSALVLGLALSHLQAFQRHFFFPRTSDQSHWTIANGYGKCCDRMVSVIISVSSSLGSSPNWTLSIVFLGKTPYPHAASLHPGVDTVGTGKFMD